MTISEFYNQLVLEYQQAELVTAPYQRKDVYRGRQHTISSIAEDMFAALLHDSLANTFAGINLYLMVDYPLRPDYEGARMFPDVAIIAEDKNPVMVSYLDLKMDLGYNRSYHESFDLLDKQVFRLRTSNVTGTKTYAKKDILISPYIKWRTVVISECNLSSHKELEKMKNAAAEHVNQFKLYFLSGKSHPNEKKREQIDTYKGKPFEELIDDLKEEINLALPMITKGQEELIK